MIIDISINNKVEKCFIFRNGNKNLNNIDTKDLTLPKLVNFTSIIKTDSQESLFIKVLPSKYNKTNKLKYYLKHILLERIFFRAKAIKEYRDSKKLASAGINTPKVFAGGFFISNMDKYNSIIIYEKLDGLITAQEILLTEKSEEKKAVLLHKIQSDYKIMARKKIHFRDLHMSNILVEPETLKLYWIDPELKRLSYF